MNPHRCPTWFTMSKSDTREEMWWVSIQGCLLLPVRPMIAGPNSGDEPSMTDHATSPVKAAMKKAMYMINSELIGLLVLLVTMFVSLLRKARQ
jgi:hypothetical protein